MLRKHVFRLNDQKKSAGELHASRRSLTCTVKEEISFVRFGFVIVDPEIRGKGYGSKMLRLGFQYVKDHPDVTRIDLGVFEDNAAAKRCYEAAGFKEFGQRKCEMSIGIRNCIDAFYISCLLYDSQNC